LFFSALRGGRGDYSLLLLLPRLLPKKKEGKKKEQKTSNVSVANTDAFR